MAPYKIIKQGYMLKEPPASKRGMRKKLRRFWFVLLEDKKQVAFVYYKNEDAYIDRQRNVGFIRIDNSRVNVVGEYQTYKNAFAIVTEKSKYTFVPESRYELHDWIFVLHNTLEGFHRRIERVRVRLEQRQRAHSTSSAASNSVHSPSSPTSPQSPVTTPTKTHPSPVATPTHTPPNASPQTGTPRHRPSHRPRRPAPIAPGRATNHPQATETSHTHNHTHHNFPYQYSPDEAFGSMSQTASSPFGTMEPRQHPVLDLDIAQLEEYSRENQEGEVKGEEEGGEEEGFFHGAQRVQQSDELRPAPVHQRSISDTSVLLCRTNSSSLPELADHTNSASPEPVAETVEEARQQMSHETPTKRFRAKHTRHLSLLNGRDGKRKKRRSQYRCRSPPNYPPPPPPANEESDNEDPTQSDPLGFSKVMQTISSIDQELQEMGGLAGTDTTPNISPPMSFRGRNPPSQASPEEPHPLPTDSEGEMRDESLSVQVENSLRENDRPALQEATGIFSPDTKTGPGEGDIETPLSPLLSPSKKTPPPIAAKPKPKPRKNKVMFKEEVEDIPSYEPRIDDEEAAPTGEVDEDIPSSVAALKKKLFGQGQTQKYTKDGPMNLRYGPIVDTESYDEDLHNLLSPTNPQTSLSPDGHKHQLQLPHFRDVDDVTTGAHDGKQEGECAEGSHENEYDTPWDSKPISKYSVVGHRKQTPSPAAAAQRAEQFEVVTTTTAIPSNTERRNVNSLERQLKTEPWVPQLPPKQKYTFSQPDDQLDVAPTHESDLLQSINNTLQTRSKYGSDSLLNMQSFSQGDVPANYYQQAGHGNVQRPSGRSARAELEKIRTQHKSITLPNAYSGGYHGSQLQQRKPLSRSQQNVNRSGWRGASVGGGGGGGGKRRGQGKGARKAQSVDELQVNPATLVTYNTYTQSHTLQSLV